MMTVLAALLMALLASFVLVIAFLACAVTVRAILQGEGPPQPSGALCTASHSLIV